LQHVTLPLVLTLLAWPLLGDRVDALGGVAVLVLAVFIYRYLRS